MDDEQIESTANQYADSLYIKEYWPLSHGSAKDIFKHAFQLGLHQRETELSLLKQENGRLKEEAKETLTEISNLRLELSVKEKPKTDFDEITYGGHKH